MTHKFIVGQAVDFSSKPPWMSGEPYEVVSVLPVDDGHSPTYRVKSKGEAFARVAKETDLVAVGLAPTNETAMALWADPVSGRRLARPFRSR